MNTHDKNTEQHECNFRDDLLVQRLGEILPTARIRKLGFLILIFMENSAWTVHQVAEDTFDLCGKISDNGEKTIDEMGITQDRLELVLMTAYDRDVLTTQTENKSSPFGSDPLGEKARKQDRTLSESISSGLFAHLKEILPVQDHECSTDDAGNFIVSVGGMKIRVVPKGANLFDVQTFVGQKLEPKQVQLSHGETVRYVFDLVSAVQPTVPSPVLGDEDQDEDENETLTGALMELAEELGQPTDFFRNRSLFNLRAGLVKDGRFERSTTGDLLSGLDEHLKAFQKLKSERRQMEKSEDAPKAKFFRGHPIAINGDMKGKTLTYVPNVGAIIVDKKDMPADDSLMLSWDNKQGAVLVPVTEQLRMPDKNPCR